MLSHAVFLSGFSLAFAGSYLGSGILVASCLDKPRKPLGLIGCTIIGAATSLAGLGLGFRLFGWLWLLILLVTAAIGGWLANEAPETRTAPRLASLYSLLGAALVACGLA